MHTINLFRLQNQWMLVNPHDVLFYPSNHFQQAGYDNSWLAGDIQLPATVGEAPPNPPRSSKSSPYFGV